MNVNHTDRIPGVSLETSMSLDFTHVSYRISIHVDFLNFLPYGQNAWDNNKNTAKLMNKIFHDTRGISDNPVNFNSVTFLLA